MKSATRDGILKLHEAMVLVQQAITLVGEPASLVLGPVVDLIANGADLAERAQEGFE